MLQVGLDLECDELGLQLIRTLLEGLLRDLKHLHGIHGRQKGRVPWVSHVAKKQTAVTSFLKKRESNNNKVEKRQI